MSIGQFVKCPQCGANVSARNRKCPACGAPLVASQSNQAPGPALSTPTILEAEIARYTQRGYRVLSRTDTSAQLLRPKKFSFLWALLWFLLFGIGLASST